MVPIVGISTLPQCTPWLPSLGEKERRVKHQGEEREREGGEREK